jgi:hypothetical protein
MARVRLILNRYKNKIFSVNKIDGIEKIMRISILRFQSFKEKCSNEDSEPELETMFVKII